MLTKDAISHFGSIVKLAAACGVKAPSVYSWGETVPALRQIQLEQITQGALKASPDVFARKKAAA